MKTLRKVTDRTPTAEGWYIVKSNSDEIFSTLFMPGDEEIWGEAFEYWYEPIDDIIKEMQAEIDYLKESKSAIRATKKSAINFIIGAFQKEAIHFAEYCGGKYFKTVGGWNKLRTTKPVTFTTEQIYWEFVHSDSYERKAYEPL